MNKQMLIYGAYGYTGELIMRQTLRQGFRPVLAGRNADKLRSLAAPLGLETRVFDLDTPDAAAQALRDIHVVMHCAGPFMRTANNMAEACLRAGTHYLDITGEIGVFEMLARLDEQAQKAGIMLLPGVGFDVVPSDCLAAHLKHLLPAATRLRLALYSKGRASHGTSLTIIENMAHGGMIRKNGVLTPVPPAWRRRDIDFGEGPRPAMTIPWGDVSTAFYSTGIPNIEVYMAASKGLQLFAAASGRLVSILGIAPVQKLMKSLVKEGGPSEQERAAGYSLFWGEATDDAGHTAAARLRVPEGYTLTALSAAHIAAKVLEGQAPPGFKTPSLAYGANLVLELPGVSYA